MYSPFCGQLEKNAILTLKPNRQQPREWKMRRTGRGGLDGLKNRNGKCEGPGGGGVDGVKNRSGNAKD
jgi:hypothetical protein